MINDNIGDDHETERIAALTEFDVIGTPAEPAFDRLARLACHVAESPVAFISFHDGAYQWLKAAEGVEFPAKLPRENTLCTRVVRSGQQVQVQDLDEDTQFCRADFVLERMLRSYAGTPITVDSGHVIGAFATMDTVPKVMPPHRRRMLTDLAALVVTELKLRKLEKAARQAVPAAPGTTDDGLSADLRRVDGFLRELTREHLEVLQSIGDGICGVNREGLVNFVNPAAERLLAQPASALLGQSFDQVVRLLPEAGADGHGRPCPIAGSLRDGTERIVRSERFRRRGAAPFPVEFISSPLRVGGEIIGAMIIFRDISASSDMRGTELRDALREVARLKDKIARAPEAPALAAIPPFGAREACLTPLERERHLADVAMRIHREESEKIKRAMALSNDVIDGPLGAAALLRLDPQTLRARLAAIEAIERPKQRSRIDRWSA